MPQAYGDRPDQAARTAVAKKSCPEGKPGALLDAGAFHPGRSRRPHLAAMAASNDIPGSRTVRQPEPIAELREYGGRAG